MRSDPDTESTAGMCVGFLRFLRGWWFFASLWFLFGVGITLGVGYGVQEYRTATQVVQAPVYVKVFYAGGSRVLAVQFASGVPRRDCANNIEWYLIGTINGKTVTVPILVTVNGLREQSDPAFDVWIAVPDIVPAGDWFVQYKTTSSCPWMLGHVTTIWYSEPGLVRLPV